ncbi:MAG: PrsW family glutamic-type intramembrane protease [Pelolinea sp.]|nr:PrsW family glutamic-type intramembrane protease [Pelolinea sp.]
MTFKKSKIPSMLLLILSALGILFGAGIVGLTLAGAYFLPVDKGSTSEVLSIATTSLLSFLVCILNLPTFISSIRKLKQKPSPHPLPPLFQKANYLIILWLLLISIGYFISQGNNATFFLVPLTIAAVSIPVWWLIECARRGLPRSTKLREWGTLTIGLTITPIIIILIEMILVALMVLVVMIGLGFQHDLNNQILPILGNLNLYQGGIAELEQILFDLMQNPVIAIGIFLTIGMLVPLIEEIFKPMAVWFLLKHPLREYEGFSLGLISGGAFALLESAGMVIQMNAEDWLTAVALRAATGVLHIGLSGLVGYGLTRSWNQKRYGKGIMYIFSAALLHGGWNSLALLSGLSSTLTQNGPGFEVSGVISIVILGCMIAIFLGIITITLRINARLRREPNTQTI